MRDLKFLIKRARENNWIVERTNGQHLRWKSPDGKHIHFSASTPSDHRAISNIRARLRRGGLDC